MRCQTFVDSAPSEESKKRRHDLVITNSSYWSLSLNTLSCTFIILIVFWSLEQVEQTVLF